MMVHEKTVDATSNDGSSGVARCFLCSRPESTVCPHCRLVHFCSPDHWARHRLDGRVCLPFMVAPDVGGGKGRGLLAAKDIAEGELVLREEPQAAGPSADIGVNEGCNAQSIICVECLTDLPESEDVHKCANGCNLPKCYSCVKNLCLSFNHDESECNSLKALGAIASNQPSELKLQLASLMLFRLLRSTGGRPTIANGVDYDRDEDQKLSKDDLYLYWTLKGHYLWPDNDQILAAIRIKNRNARSLDMAGNNRGTGLYPVFSLLNHSCRANAKSKVGAAVVERPREGGFFAVEVRAAVPISRGDEITARYVHFTLGEPEKSLAMQQKWGFACSCKLCSPEDGGAEGVEGVEADVARGSTAVRCSALQAEAADKSCPGFLAKEKGCMSWQCRICHCRVSGEAIKKFLDSVTKSCSQKRLQMQSFGGSMNADSDGGVDASRRTVRALEEVLHSDNVLLTKHRFCLLRALNNLKLPTTQECVEMLDLTAAVLRLADVADRGLTRSRGLTLAIRAAAHRRMANAEVREQEELWTDERRRRLRLAAGAARSHVAAREAVRCLRHDCCLDSDAAKRRTFATKASVAARREVVQALASTRGVHESPRLLDEFVVGIGFGGEDDAALLMAQIKAEETWVKAVRKHYAKLAKNHDVDTTRK